MKRDNYVFFIIALYVMGLFIYFVGMNNIANISAEAWGWAILTTIGLIFYTTAVYLNNMKRG